MELQKYTVFSGFLVSLNFNQRESWMDNETQVRKKQTTGRQELVDDKTHQPQNPTNFGVANPIAIPLTKDN